VSLAVVHPSVTDAHPKAEPTSYLASTYSTLLVRTSTWSVIQCQCLGASPPTSKKSDVCANSWVASRCASRDRVAPGQDTQSSSRHGD
jgi:hypothetical protein